MTSPGAPDPSRKPARATRGPVFSFVALATALGLSSLFIKPTLADAPSVETYRERVEPLVVEYCHECHANGLRKGGVSFDERDESALVADRGFWSTALKNVRAGIMPPAGKPRPSAEQVKSLGDWVKADVLKVDPADPDPGRVTIRRLNRVEYRNTIHDLMGFEFLAEQEFPPDDTGYGFDTIGDVLSVSPLLLEKYLEAAETIVTKAVPTVSSAMATESLRGSSFKGDKVSGDRLDGYKASKVSRTFRAPKAGTYEVTATIEVRGEFDFDPGQCSVTFLADGQTVTSQEFAWGNGKKTKLTGTFAWPEGRHDLAFELQPLTDPKKRANSLNLGLVSVEVAGPTERELWSRPKNWEKFFDRDDPTDDAARKAYAKEVLTRFASKAYRRPVDARTVDKLLAIAEEVYRSPGKNVEQGIAQAMVAVLASPRFLFRVEGIEPADSGKKYPRIDEYALASRLSYFLWSTMPDDELLDLAKKGELRKNLTAQVKRLLDDPRSNMFTRNFTGQWLQARDVEGIAIDPRAVLARDEGYEKDLKKEQEEFRAFLAERTVQQKAQAKAQTKDQAKDQNKAQAKTQGRGRFASRFPRLFGPVKAELDGPLRDAMRLETEKFFESIVHDDRSILDLVDSDYTFLNERLAKHYGIPGVKGPEMRKVSLPKDSPRGGLLTQGTVLVVTSNPTRTSPVKRGLFILDNIMGTPAPPPPANVPQLEEAEKAVTDREPTLREMMKIHREKPICNACHSRMDPLGLALENFNALGIYRESERKQPIDSSGVLISGEPFGGIRDLKRILRTDRRLEFERCLTEKLLTYALGRGMEPEDIDAVDRIVERLERENGRFSALLMGIVESAPFQKRRDVTVARGPGVDDKGARP